MIERADDDHAYSPEQLGQIVADMWSDIDNNRAGLVDRLEHDPGGEKGDAHAKVLDAEIILEPWFNKKRSFRILMGAMGLAHRPAIEPSVCIVPLHEQCPKKKPDPDHHGEYLDCTCTMQRFPDPDAILKRMPVDVDDIGAGASWKEVMRQRALLALDIQLVTIYRLAARRQRQLVAARRDLTAPPPGRQKPMLTSANRPHLKGRCDACERDICWDELIWLERSTGRRWHKDDGEYPEAFLGRTSNHTSQQSEGAHA